MWPALIAAGASLIGSKMAQDTAEDQQNIQREFAQSGIQWKVQDAKAAGVHPLFALGASPASYSPVVSQAPQMIADAGQNISRAAMASQQAKDQAQVQAAQIRASDASAAKDFAQAQYYASLAGRSQQEQQSAAAMPPAVPIPIYRQYGGDFEVKPFREPIEGQSVGRAVGTSRVGKPTDLAAWVPKANEVPGARGSNPGIGAGPGKPMFDDFVLPFSVNFPTEFGYTSVHPRILLPQGGSASEAIEALSEGGTSSPMFGAIAAINIAHYGKDYWDLIVQAVRNDGANPDRRFRGSERGYQRGEKYRRGYRGAM